MAYSLKALTIRTDNSEEGMKKIAELWQDVIVGKLPIIHDSEMKMQEKISPIAMYSNYEDRARGAYDLSIIAVEPDFFKEIEQKVAMGMYKKYDYIDENNDIFTCTHNAWKQVWSDTTSGNIRRTFSADFESTVPKEYTKDGKVHCYLYISVQ